MPHQKSVARMRGNLAKLPTDAAEQAIKRMAKVQRADIYFGDAAHIRSIITPGAPGAKKGQTPVVAATGAGHAMSLISATTSKGCMRSMIKETGGVNADVFIEFLKRLLDRETRNIFLIVDRGSAHRAKKTRAFVETLAGRLKLFFPPPYSPDRNPEELVWKHLKADTVGRMVVTGKADFKSKVVSSMRSLQTSPGEDLFRLPEAVLAVCRMIVNLLMDLLLTSR